MPEFFHRKIERTAIGFVIAIIAAASVLAATAMGGGFRSMQLKASARQIASNLRYTRAQAIATGEPQKDVFQIGRPVQIAQRRSSAQIIKQRVHAMCVAEHCLTRLLAALT